MALIALAAALAFSWWARLIWKDIRKMKYFTYVGSFEGVVKIGSRWVRVKNLNLVNKTGWKRHQGPPTKAMEQALKNPTAKDGREIIK